MPHGMEVGLGPGDFVLDVDPAPSPKKGAEPRSTLPNFRPLFVVANGWMNQVALSMDVGLGPGHIVLDGDPAPLSQKRRRSPLPNFRPISIVVKRLDSLRCHLV